jgi:hypothetical protein
MIRKEFLKRAGMAGLASLLPLGRVQTAAAAANAARRPAVGSCTLIPSETAGPYPLDLHTQATYFRQDIRENKPGVLLTVRLRIMNNNTCLPWPTPASTSGTATRTATTRATPLTGTRGRRTTAPPAGSGASR